MSSRICAVLTGDLVDSTRLSASEMRQVRTIAQRAARTAASWQPDFIDYPLEFFRGDSWQVLLNDPRFALRFALWLRALLRSKTGVDSRVSIAIGAVGTLNPKQISLSRGEAFVLSGRGLDELPADQRMSILLPAEANELGSWMPVIADLCDGIVQDWKPRQMEVLSLAMVPERPTQQAIADQVSGSLSRQAVSKSLQGAGWPRLERTLKQFEETDWKQVCSAVQPKKVAK